MDTNIFGIGMNELIVIFVLAGIILGPERLARVAREAGKFIRNLKGYFSSLTGELKAELDILDDSKNIISQEIKKVSKPAEQKPAEIKPAEPKQVDPKPVESKLDEQLEAK
jgi:sec-independent protein translocase protein TatB